MNRITFQSRVGSDGVLQFTLPVGKLNADQEVQVTVEPVPSTTVSSEAWRQMILDTAGKWQGDFERDW